MLEDFLSRKLEIILEYTNKTKDWLCILHCHEQIREMRAVAISISEVIEITLLLKSVSSNLHFSSNSRR